VRSLEDLREKPTMPKQTARKQKEKVNVNVQEVKDKPWRKYYKYVKKVKPVVVGKRYKCSIPGCTYKGSDNKGNYKQHLSFKHNVGTVWFHCDVEGCEYKGKAAALVKHHKANRHGIGVVWYPCPREDCSYKAKQKKHLDYHIKVRHDPESVIAQLKKTNGSLELEKQSLLTRLAELKEKNKEIAVLRRRVRQLEAVVLRAKNKIEKSRIKAEAKKVVTSKKKEGIKSL